MPSLSFSVMHTEGSAAHVTLGSPVAGFQLLVKSVNGTSTLVQSEASSVRLKSAYGEG